MEEYPLRMPTTTTCWLRALWMRFHYRALSLDSNDYLAEFHVALELAQLRQVCLWAQLGHVLRRFPKTLKFCLLLESIRFEKRKLCLAGCVSCWQPGCLLFLPLFCNQIPEALKHVRKALRLKSDHVHSLHLLVLLLSAQKQYGEALDLMDAALEEHPDHFRLLTRQSPTSLFPWKHAVGSSERTLMIFEDTNKSGVWSSVAACCSPGVS